MNYKIINLSDVSGKDGFKKVFEELTFKDNLFKEIEQVKKLLGTLKNKINNIEIKLKQLEEVN